MTLVDLKAAAGNLAAAPHGDLIKLFGWWLHVHRNKPYFSGSDIGKCYDELHIPRPMSFGGYFRNLEGKDLLKNVSGYRLSGPARDALDATYGAVAQRLPIKQLLKDLPAKLGNLAERKYLDETLLCYECGALRAAIVMTWNIAYAHLCDHVLKNRLADFNARWKVSYPGMHKTPKAVAGMDDFNDYLKEHEVLQICRDANIITRNVYNVLEPALKKRNAAAHPNNVFTDIAIVDGFISDLINNAVLKI